MNSHRLGRKTEKLNEIDGQHSFFDEVENCCELDVDEPELQIVIRKARRKKKKDQRELDLKDYRRKRYLIRSQMSSWMRIMEAATGGVCQMTRMPDSGLHWHHGRSNGTALLLL